MRKAHAVRPESRDVDARLILAFAGGLVALILLVLGGMRLLFGVTPLPLPFGAGTGLFGSGNPVLETDTAGDRAAYDTEKRKELNALSWVDRSAGIAHIPIDEAMRMIAASGVPDWGQHATPTGGCGAVAEQVPRAPPGAGCPQPAATP
jgi:hypothetical protein